LVKKSGNVFSFWSRLESIVIAMRSSAKISLESIIFEQKKELSQETKDWLQFWTETAPRGLPPNNVIEELKPYRPTETKLLWRYVQNVQTEDQKQLLSWLPTVKEVISSFFEGPPMYIKVAEVEPSNILVDMRLVVNAYPEMDNFVLPDEVITYQLKVTVG
jgi:hypothetical protein